MNQRFIFSWTERLFYTLILLVSIFLFLNTRTQHLVNPLPKQDETYELNRNVRTLKNSVRTEVLASEISSTWKIPKKQAELIIHYAFQSANESNIDPFIILGVIAHESSFRHRGNPGAFNGDELIDPFKPHGLMQVSGRFHREKFPNKTPKVTNDLINLRIGAAILREYINLESGNLNRALLRYNGSINDKSEKYPVKVIGTANYFKEFLRIQNFMDNTSI